MKLGASGLSVLPRARRAPAWLGIAGLCLSLLAMATPASAASALDQSAVAGYLTAPAGGVAAASFRFKVPKVKCSSGEERAVTIGLGDVQDLESPELRAHVMLTCPAGGRAEYTFAAQACSHSAGPLATKHGHKITVALAQSRGVVTMSVIDEDEGTTISSADSIANCGPSGTLESVLFGALPVFAPTLRDVPDFNKIKSRDATLNGADLSGERVNRKTNPGIKTSKLRTELSASLSAASKKSGDAFSLKFRKIVHCCLETPSSAGAPRRAG